MSGRGSGLPSGRVAGDPIFEERSSMAMTPRWSLRLGLVSVLMAVPLARAAGGEADKPPASDAPVSYYKQIRPIFQAHCQGCHQPAKPGGGYVMTAFDRMLAGGKSKASAIVPQKPDESFLVDQITPEGGKAEMPRGEKPLNEAEIELVKRWIAQGAVDDTPQNARARYDMDHPPVYTRPPVITAIDYAPDGELMAVAGFHEVLLMS